MITFLKIIVPLVRDQASLLRNVIIILLASGCSGYVWNCLLALTYTLASLSRDGVCMDVLNKRQTCFSCHEGWKKAEQDGS
jgi:hypothetical protein